MSWTAGVRFPTEIPLFSTTSGAHPASYTVGTGGSFPGGKAVGLLIYNAVYIGDSTMFLRIYIRPKLRGFSELLVKTTQKTVLFNDYRPVALELLWIAAHCKTYTNFLAHFV
jgi:hypothetical protein